MAAPWATHYDVPGPRDSRVNTGPSNGRGGSREGSADRSSGRGRAGVPGPYRDDYAPSRAGPTAGFSADNRRAHAAAVAANPPSENAAVLGSENSDAGWKRPRTLAPPWAAGGGQEMILSSPAQGRKVSFVIEKPAYYNVEDAPSAVPTSRSDRSWSAGDSRSRPTTPAAPPVLRGAPGVLALRPRTPAPPHGQALPRESVDLGDGSADGGTPQWRPDTPERDTGPLQFVKEAEASLLERSPAGHVVTPRSVASMATTAVDAGDEMASAVAEPGIWNTSPPPSGRGRDAYGVAIRGRPPTTGSRGSGGGRGVGRGAESARDRAKDHYDSVTKTMRNLKDGGTGGGVKRRPTNPAAPHAKLGPERASERVTKKVVADREAERAALIKRAETLEVGVLTPGRGGGGSPKDLSPRSRQARARQW